MSLRLGHQFGDITPISDRRLELCAQLGVEEIAIHTIARAVGHHPRMAVFDRDGAFDADALRRLRLHVESFGLRLTAVHQELGSLHADLALHRHPERSAASLERVAHNVRAVAEAGIPALKYNLQLIGIVRTGTRPGRGGVLYRSFDAATATPELVRRHSVFIDDAQQLDGEIARVTAARSWEAIERFLETVVPVADDVGVYLACHPHDPPFPQDGLFGVHHVLGSIAGMKRFAELSSSRYHVFNFCQGTVSEMCADPGREVIDAIRYFGARSKIFMVHLRSIRGRYLQFEEVHVDDGNVNMVEAMRAYRDVGFEGLLAPDHVPISDHDPDSEIQFGFGLGYIRGLIQAVNGEGDRAGSRAHELLTERAT